MKHTAFTAAALVALCCPFGCRAPAPAEGAPQALRIEGLGRIDFANSGPSAAQEPFVRGMLLLHSFEYADAAEAFREAQALAPDFVLAYWGEALTHCHPIWQEENRDAARAALERLAPTPSERAAKAVDERERELLAAVEGLFGEGTRAERAQGYCRAMAALHARYPDDLEIAALHSLSVLGTATQGRDIPTYMRAGALAEQVLARAPEHPGALHYAIHSFDDPVHAPLGLRMARSYGTVAASAEHALHMPSHIYVALGMWPESVEANVAAAAAADRRRARKGLGVEARGLHSLAWLAYSYQQLGDSLAAEHLLDDMRRDEAEKSSKRTRGALVSMRAAWVIGAAAWTDEHARYEIDIEELEPAVACAELYLRGRVAVVNGDAAAAGAALEAMAPLRGALDDLPASGANAAQCCLPGGSSGYMPDRLAARVMELELAGLIALAADEREGGLALLRTAAEREDAMGYDFGPPAVVEPAHELYGMVLLELGDATAAASEFEAALERAPGRRRSLDGLARARAAVP